MEEIRGTRIGRVGVWLGRLGWMPAAANRRTLYGIDARYATIEGVPVVLVADVLP